jgi:DNA modification methylase
LIRDIKPRSPIDRLRRDFSDAELASDVSVDEVLPVVGISRSFLARALGLPAGSRPKAVSLAQVIDLLDTDGYQETFLPRSMIPDYLLQAIVSSDVEQLAIPANSRRPLLEVGDARLLLKGLPSRSVQCTVTSSPYWGMRLYDNDRDLEWADGEQCPYGFEQTPEGFIRHTIELLYLLKPAMIETGSVWWNLMDTYNTRTPIRGSSKEKLHAMSRHPDFALGWTEHAAVRHSAGHMYLDDGELASIPMRVAERASRIGYTLKSFITWNKHSTPEPVKSRVTRQAEYILHLAVGGHTPLFQKTAWQDLERRLGGRDPATESAEKLTDVWSLPTAQGKNGHGAEFPLALPGRCIALTSEPDDLILDPFVGGGTSALAAIELERRFVGFDISKTYVTLADGRVRDLLRLRSVSPPLQLPLGLSTSPTTQVRATVHSEPAAARSRPRPKGQPSE